MDIKRLQQFITLSNEDFADAHEPVNDGVKDVPDASDIAKMVTRSGGSGESDLTTQGEGKVIPEQPDSEEETEKKEETTVTETTEETETPAKAPPFEKKEPAVKEVKDPEQEEADTEKDFKKITDTVDTLKHSQIAVEQYVHLLRSNKRISKQAAAIIQVGLEHIDSTCGLKVRNFGLESFDTTPKSAMESADVDESSLLSRASEIGAKILKWLKELIATIYAKWDEYKNGLDQLQNKVEELSKRNFKTEGNLELASVPNLLFQEGEFVGGHVTDEENGLPRKLEYHFREIAGVSTKRVLNKLSGDDVNEIVDDIKTFTSKSGEFSKLPGDKWINLDEGKLVLTEVDPDAPDTYTVEISDFDAKVLLSRISTNIKVIKDLDIAVMIKRASDQVTEGIIKYRKGDGSQLDETELQRVQQAVIDGTVGLIDASSLFAILRQLARIHSARLAICKNLVV